MAAIRNVITSARRELSSNQACPQGGFHLGCVQRLADGLLQHDGMAFSFSNEQATGFENVLSDFEIGGGRLCLLVELAYHISQHRWAEIMKTIEICVIDCGSHDCEFLSRYG